jgi:hypothetical protein
METLPSGFYTAFFFLSFSFFGLCLVHNAHVQQHEAGLFFMRAGLFMYGKGS